MLKQLIAFAYALIGDGVNKDERVEMARDFAVDAITKYLENKSKFDPERNPDLVLFLKYNYVRQRVSNYHKSAKKLRVGQLPEAGPELNRIEINHSVEIDVDLRIDGEQLFMKIQSAIEHDDKLYPIFLKRYHEDAKRSEICEDLGISTNEYTNRMKRLKRIVTPIIKSNATTKQ